MVKFEVKYFSGSEVRSEVLTASDESAAGKRFSSSHKGISADDVISVRRIDQYSSKYGPATLVAWLIIIGGSILLIFGVGGVILGVSIANGLYVDALRDADPTKKLFLALAIGGAYLSLVIAIIGLLMAAIGHHLRATTDAANCLGEILVIMKSSIATSTSALMRSSIATPLPESATRFQNQVSKAKFCSGCGAAAVEAGSAFCAQCGAKL